MANFKRGRAKNRRSGCILCKPWKANGAKAAVRDTPQDTVAKLAEREQLAEYDHISYDFDDDEWEVCSEWGVWGVCSDLECPECNWREILSSRTPPGSLGPLFKTVTDDPDHLLSTSLTD